MEVLGKPPDHDVELPHHLKYIAEDTFANAKKKLRAFEDEIRRLTRIELAHNFHIQQTVDLQRARRLRGLANEFRQLHDLKFFNKLERLYFRQRAKLYTDEAEDRMTMLRKRTADMRRTIATRLR